jgi:hypothetical protein
MEKQNLCNQGIAAGLILVTSALSVLCVGPAEAAKNTPETIPLTSHADPVPTRLHVSADGHFLQREDGSRFVWLADTVWALQKLNPTDLARYMDDRAARGFNVLQGPNLRGWPENPTSPENYVKGVNYAGQPAFLGNNTDTPNEPYWQYVDYMVNAANSRGLYIALVVMWGNEYNLAFGTDTQKANRLGVWLGTRYRNNLNVIWIVSGEFDLIGTSPITSAQKAMFAAVGQGLKTGSLGNHLITAHPAEELSSTAFQSEAWFDFNMEQGGHAMRDNPNIYGFMTTEYGATPTKPALDGEVTYEETAVNWNIANGVFTDYDVRKSAYWSVFAGGFGFTYGDEYMFQLYRPGDTWYNPTWANMGTPNGYWYDKLGVPGAVDMRHVRALMELHTAAWIPDQAVISSAIGTGTSHRQAVRASDGSFAFVYIPDGGATTVNMAHVGNTQVTASWYDPRLGYTSSPIGSYANTGTLTFTPPSSGTGNDWVLRLEGTGTPVPLDFTPPIATITAPANNATVPKNKVTTIGATATDNVQVSKVEFYIGTTLTCTDTAAPYTCTWSVPAPPNRTYSLQVKAYDPAGNRGSSSVVNVTSK